MFSYYATLINIIVTNINNEPDIRHFDRFYQFNMNVAHISHNQLVNKYSIQIKAFNSSVD
jgi:hypothetical protein